MSDERIQVVDQEEDRKSGIAPSHANEKGRKPRGKGIIYFGLREADEALRKIDQHAKRMSRQGFAVALGHKKPENRFAQKIDALTTFTLLEEDGDDVKLTTLATDMLYSGSETARNQARNQAFLAYPNFQRTFIECPKNQDHQTSYIREFVTGKLGIINEADRFLRLFLESAYFAGLLESEPDPKAERVRFRPGAAHGTNGSVQRPRGTHSISPRDEPVADVERENVLKQFGLTQFAERIAVFRADPGRVKTVTDGGKLTIEIPSTLRLEMQCENVIDDLIAVLTVLKAGGFNS